MDKIIFSKNFNKANAKNNYYMHGSDAFNPGDEIGVYYSDSDTSIHHHDFIEIIYFKSGVGKHVINGKTFNVSSGDVCILNTGVKHYYNIAVQKLKSISVINCIFYASYLGKDYHSNNFINEAYDKIYHNQLQSTTNFIQINCDKNRHIATLFNILKDEFDEQRVGYDDVMKMTLQSIITKIFREYTNKSTKHNLSHQNKILLEKSLIYIKNNIHNSLTLSDIAKRCNYSTVYFNNIFKEYTGFTFLKFLQKARCAKACELLEKTDFSIETICDKCGYSDPKHFFSLFKNHVGTTPGQYRKTKKRK